MSPVRSTCCFALALVATAATSACDSGADPTATPPAQVEAIFTPRCGGAGACVPVVAFATARLAPAAAPEAPLVPAPEEGGSRRREDASAAPDAERACTAGWQVAPSETEVELPTEVQPFDHLGLSVALAGDHVVAGADGDDSLGEDSGAAWTFERDQAGAWRLAEPLSADDGGAEDHFGWSVDIDGDVLAVGAPRHRHDGGLETGAVYVFERNSGAWEQVAELRAPVRAGAQFGEGVRVRGDRILVGAQHDDSRGADTGAAFIYHRASAGWELEARLAPRTAVVGARFGAGLALARDLAFVGADGEGAGVAYVFRRDGAIWREEAQLAPPDRTRDALFGGALDSDGRNLIIGGQGQEVAGVAGVGSAWSYLYVDGEWRPRGLIVPPSHAAEAHFGASVRLAGDQVAIGAWGDAEHGEQRGSAWIFAKRKASWFPEARLVDPRGAAADRLGLAVGFADGLVVAGVWGADAAGTDAGKIVVFASRECAGATSDVE